MFDHEKCNTGDFQADTTLAICKTDSFGNKYSFSLSYGFKQAKVNNGEKDKTTMTPTH